MAKNSNADAQIQHIEYSRDVIHGYSKGIGKIFDLELSYIGDFEKQYRSGKNVIYSLGMQDSPLVYASGAIPVAFSEISRLGSSEAVTVSEDLFQIPRDICSMVKVMLGEFYLRKDQTIKRILHTNKICEPINAIMQYLPDFGYQIYNLDFGYKFDDLTEKRYINYINFVADEYRKAAEWISGEPLNEDKLYEEMKRYNRVMKKVRLIMNLRRQHNAYIKSLPTMFTLMGIGHLFGKPEEYEEALDILLEELTSLKSGDYHDEKLVNLVWTGGRGMEFGVYQAVDDAGGTLAGWCLNNCYTAGFDETLPPMEAFVKFNVGGRYSGTANPVSLELEKEIEKVNGKGIVSYLFNGCSYGGISVELIREHFKKRGISLISIDGSFQVGEPTGQLITRIKAFVEMLS